MVGLFLCISHWNTIAKSTVSSAPITFNHKYPTQSWRKIAITTVSEITADQKTAFALI